MLKRIVILGALIALLLSACSGGVGLRAPESEAGAPPAEFAPVAEQALDEGRGFDQASDLDTKTAQLGERLVIKNADMNVVVDDPVSSLDSIARMAESMGGFVVSSNLYQTELASGEEVPRASITIRVPADRLNDALSQIEAGANRVLGRNESGQDVTQEYTDLQSRLRNLEDAEEQLRTILDRATRTEDVLSVFNQLTQVREQIEVIKGQIQFFEQSAAFSAIHVELIANAAVQPLTIGGWEPAGVARDAVQALINALKGLANAGIWLALFVLPVAAVLLIPLALLWRGFRSWRARRKSAPLAPPEASTPES